MTNINDIIYEQITNLFSRQSKGQHDLNAPWNLLNVNSNYNPHLQVRPTSTEFHNWQNTQNNISKNPNQQPINQRTARFTLQANPNTVNKPLNITSANLLPNTKVTALHQQVSTNIPGLKVPPSQRYINWRNMSPSQIN